MNQTEIQLKIQCRDEASGNVVDGIITTAKIAKIDGAKSAGDVLEEHIYINIKPGSLPNYQDALITVNTDHKLTKATSEES